MVKYHVNPETGKSGACRASLHNCPFNDDENHFEAPAEAQKAYEEFAEKITTRESVRFGFTIAEMDAFTNGDCAHLALALHKKTGWPLVAFNPDPLDGFQHVAVQTPDGRILDVEGIFTREDFAKAWDVKPSAIRLSSPDEIQTMIDYGLNFDKSPAKTSTKMLKVIEPLLPEVKEENLEEKSFSTLFSRPEFKENDYVKASEEFMSKQTEAQREALQGYVIADYEDVNNLLYNEKDYSGREKRGVVRGKIKELDKALKHSPVAPPVLWRSMSGRQAPQEFIKNGYKTGDIIEFDGFTSTSETPDALMHVANDVGFYMDDTPEDQWQTEGTEGLDAIKIKVPRSYNEGAARNVFFKISAKKAAPVSTLRQTLAEQEWLLPRGKKFRVKAIHRNVHVGELEQLRSGDTRAQIFELEEV